jgi:RNA polymerase sigma-70 factor (ECF subfamily)
MVMAAQALMSIAPSDALLMEQLAQGETGALGTLHQRYGRAVTSIVRGVEPTLSTEEAEDLCQEIWVTLFETAPRYQDRGNLKSWLFGIAVRKVRGNRRRLWFRRAIHRQHGAATAGVRQDRESDLSDRLATHQQIELVLTSLTPAQREVLVLHVVQGLAGAEVARTLGISEGAVWTRIHRARKAAIELLGSHL